MAWHTNKPVRFADGIHSRSFTGSSRIFQPNQLLPRLPLSGTISSPPSGLLLPSVWRLPLSNSLVAKPLCLPLGFLTYASTTVPVSPLFSASRDRYPANRRIPGITRSDGKDPAISANENSTFIQIPLFATEYVKSTSSLVYASVVKRISEAAQAMVPGGGC